MCNDCITIFTKYALLVFRQAKHILTGLFNAHDGLCDLPLPSTRTLQSQTNVPTHSANAIIRKDCTKTELACYLHSCVFSPALHTFQRPMANLNLKFVTWPTITKINYQLTQVSRFSTGHFYFPVVLMGLRFCYIQIYFVYIIVEMLFFSGTTKMISDIIQNSSPQRTTTSLKHRTD